MTAETKGKSASVITISVFFVFTAFLIALHSLINYNFNSVVRVLEIMRMMELEVPIFLRIVFSLNRYFLITSALELAFAFLVVFSAIDFLKLKNRARVALMVFALIEIILFLNHLGFWAMMVTALPTVTAQFLGVQSPEIALKVYYIYAGVISAFVFLPLVISGIVLTTKKTRSLMQY
jgi:hypothetical protein